MKKYKERIESMVESMQKDPGMRLYTELLMLEILLTLREINDKLTPNK